MTRTTTTRTTTTRAAQSTARSLARTVAVSLGLAGLLAVSACSSGSHDAEHPASGSSVSATAGGVATGAPAAGAHNDADVTFATDMIPHHGQAVTMSDLALSKASNADVKKLATAIKGAQDPEIRTMGGWLAGWGKPVPDPKSEHAGHDASMEGMMSEEEMASLESASGAAFDRLWLELMVKHHEGAVAMSRTALQAASNPEVKKLAQAIIDGQTAEIQTMQGLLEELPG